MAKTMKKLDSKLQKQQQGWPKISNTARKYNKDENLENYDSEVQMYGRAHLCHDWPKRLVQFQLFEKLN